MKNYLKSIYKYAFVAAVLIAGATSCKKEISGTTQEETIVTTSTSSTIAVSSNTVTSSADSIYVVNPCERGTHRDSVAVSALPAAVQTYLSANYTGYTFNKAFAVKDTTGAVKGYVVIVNFNGKPVAVEFKADGIFVKVLE